MAAATLRSDEALGREVALVGALIAAVAGGVLLASLFVGWYRRPGFCDVPICPGTASSGFASLHAAAAILAGAALAGWLPLAGAVTGRARALAAAGGGLAGLGAAAFVVFRIAVAPGALGPGTPARMAGPFVALLGALGLACGSALSGLRERFFAPARHGTVALGAIGVASLAAIVSLALPWTRETTFPDAAPATSAWHGAPTMAVLLLLGALAIIGAGGLVAVIRWRCAFFALAVGGWLVAAIAAGVTPLESDAAGPFDPVRRLAGYGSGYYLCLGAATVIALAGMVAAVTDPAPAGPTRLS